MSILGRQELEDGTVVDQPPLTVDQKRNTTQITPAQRLAYEVAVAIAKTPIGTYKTNDALQFAFVCKLADVFASRVVGFDSDKFFIAAGYKKQ